MLWQKTGASAAIARLPGLAAVLPIEYSCQGKCNMIFLRIVRSGNDPVRIRHKCHRLAMLLRFAQNFESPSNGKSGWRNLRGWPDAASNASAAR